jgi:ferrous iron transport protein A
LKLNELNKNDNAIIKNIQANDELKKRFYSFGIIKNAQILVENVSLTKNVIEIDIEDTSIGLRLDEAKCIEVEIIK